MLLAARARRAFGLLLPCPGLRGRLAGKLAVHGVGSQVEAVRPAHGAEFIDRHLTEYRLVAQRLEHLAGEFAGQVYGPRNTVVELDVKPVFRERVDFHNAGHHLTYSKGVMLLSGLCCCASAQLSRSSRRCSSAHSSTRPRARRGKYPAITSRFSMSIFASLP